MKKHLLVLALTLVLFSGCTFFQQQEAAPPAAAPQELQTEKKTGLISSTKDQELASGPSQFVLVTDTGERIYIDSVSINLKKYQKRRVEIEGLWNTEKTLFAVSNVTALGNETDLKTPYAHQELGLKFSYPSLWAIKENRDVSGSLSLTLTPYGVDESELASVDRVMIEKFDNPRRAAVRDYLHLDDNYISTIPNAENETYQKSAIGISQLDAVKRTIHSGQEINFYVTRDTFVYRFTHITLNDADKDTYRNAFFDIVQSFEFIPLSKPAVTGSTTTSLAPLALVAPPIALHLPPPPEKAPPLEIKPAPKLETKLEPKPETAPPPPAPAPHEPTLAEVRQTFVAYASANIATLAHEPAESGSTWSVKYLQFAAPAGSPEKFNALYIVYGDGKNLRKILLSVPDQKKPDTMTFLAYFKPGETTDWQAAEGTDTAKNSEKAVVEVNGSASSEVVIQSGMQLLDARLLKVKIQYPAKWYWAQASGGYNFSNKPVASDNVLVRFSKGEAGGLPAFQATADIGGKKAQEQIDNADYAICVQGNTADFQFGAAFCMKGKIDYRDQMKAMLATLQE